MKSISKAVSGVIDVVEEVAYFCGSIFGSHSGSYCDIETSDGPNTLVTKSGYLLSGIKIHGINEIIGPDEFEDVCEQLNQVLSPLFSQSGHVVEFWFERDPSTGKEALDEALRPSVATARRLKLDLVDMLSSKSSHLSKYCSNEKFFIGIWSLPTVLPKQSQKAAAAEKTKDLRNVKGFPSVGAQNILASMPDVREIHESAVANLIQSLKEIGFTLELMSSHDMIREIRTSLFPSMTDPSWRPSLPGDPVPRMKRGDIGGDSSDIQYPPIPWQIFAQDLERSKDRKTVEVGDRIYAPLFIEIPPTTIMPFSRLFARINAAGVPWRISFVAEGGGLENISTKAMLASIATWASRYNKQIDEAMTAMQEAAQDESFVNLRISLCTWAPKGQDSLLADRVNRVAKAATGWGQAEIRQVSGDPVLGLVSACPFLTLENAANPIPAPVADLVRMLPIDRLSSYWKEGGVIFRTLDGRIVPFEPGSSLQSTWSYLFAARPGMGKSVLMASINLASCVRAGAERLPYISYIDIGPSSKGFVDLIRDALPESKRHLAAHFKMRMTKDYAVNPFDTQLGLRHPLPDEHGFLVDLLSMLATPAESEAPYQSISSLSAAVIDAAYKSLEDGPKSKPKTYSRGVVPAVDAVLDMHHYYPEKGEPWWAIVDFLFDQGEIHLATIAQRYAVPTLADIAAAAQDPSINDIYGNVRIGTSETLPRAFARMLSDAIRDYAPLSCETRFDIGDTRILAIDLDEVAKDGGTSARRQSAIMYMIARFIAARNFRLHKDIVPGIPERYRAHYRTKVEQIHSTMKWIIYDEFHRTSFSPSIRNQVIIDMREGRKWNLGVMLASQTVEDFDETMKEFSTGVFIMGAGTSKGADELQGLFGFNDTSKRMLTQYANGPSSAGAPFLAQFYTKRGGASQFLVSSISPIETWGFSTTAEDVVIRDELYRKMGQREARALLAHHFPGGSAKEEVERIKIAQGKDKEEEDLGAIQQVVERLLEAHANEIKTAA